MPKYLRNTPPKKSKYPGFSLVVMDEKVKGCEFHLNDTPVYTSEPTPLVFADGTIYTQVNLLDTIVGKTPYWLIYYSLHLDEFLAWVKKDSFDQETVTRVAKNCFIATLQIIMRNRFVAIPIADSLSLYVEDKLPGVRILEFGELPNGVMSSDLVTNVDDVLGVFLGETKEKDKMPSNIDTSVIDKLVAADTERVRKQRHKRQAKQEKRQKNWSRAKNGKADS